MFTATTIDTTAILKGILAVDPQASLHKIRRAHPALGAMSFDHLCLRLERLLECGAEPSGK